MKVKELKDILSKYDDNTEIYIDVHDGYWQISGTTEFVDEENNTNNLAIKCKCSLPINIV